MDDERYTAYIWFTAGRQVVKGGKHYREEQL